MCGAGVWGRLPEGPPASRDPLRSVPEQARKDPALPTGARAPVSLQPPRQESQDRTHSEVPK